jgi:hypothetical protein
LEYFFPFWYVWIKKNLATLPVGRLSDTFANGTPETIKARQFFRIKNVSL